MKPSQMKLKNRIYHKQKFLFMLTVPLQVKLNQVLKNCLASEMFLLSHHPDESHDAIQDKAFQEPSGP